MNANRMINMVIRMVMRRLMRSGVDAGINALGRRNGTGAEGASPGQQTDAAPNVRKTRQRMRQSMRTMRRFGRF